jgi:hypothetical protein
MFDFDVVTGPSDLAKIERSEARRSPPPRNPSVAEAPPADAPSSVSSIVAEDTPGYPALRPA